MPSLCEVQRAMRDRVLGPAPRSDAPLLADLILPAGLSAARRLDVHRNNTLASLAAALAETYPVILRLVGEGFFTAAARAFILRTPPREARLSRYGGGFADFLADYPPARQLPYLPDVARLEWAVNEAFHAADAPPLDPARLAGLDSDRSAALSFVLHPSCRLLASPYPVERIWQVNQRESDAAETIDLAAGGCRVLLWRDGLDLRIASLDAAGFAFLAALAAGAPLDAAYDAAAAKEPGFDLAAALQRQLAAGLLTDVHFGENAR